MFPRALHLLFALIIIFASYLGSLSHGLLFLILTISLIAYFLGNYRLFLLMLLCTNPFTDVGVTIATSKLGLISQLNAALMLASVIKILTNNGYRIFLDRYFFPIFIFFLLVLILSLVFNEVNAFFFTDVVIYIVPLIVYFLFKGVDNSAIIDCFLIACAAAIIAFFIMFLSGFTLNEMPSYIMDYVVDYRDPLLAMYLLTAILLLFLRTEFRLFSIFIILSIIIGVYLFGINFMGFGSQTLIVFFLAIVLLFFYFLFHSPFRDVIIYLPLSILIISTLYFVVISNEYGYYKLENIHSLIYVFKGASIDLYPYSVQVRVVSFMNILDRSLLGNLFGSGFGSYFSESVYGFPRVDDSAFTMHEISNGKFYFPHNIGYQFLKTGIILPVFLLWLSWRAFRINIPVDDKILFAGMLLLVFFNFGYGYKYSLLLGLVLVIYKNLINSSKARGVNLTSLQ
jgi:hypothetical protein